MSLQRHVQDWQRNWTCIYDGISMYALTKGIHPRVTITLVCVHTAQLAVNSSDIRWRRIWELQRMKRTCQDFAAIQAINVLRTHMYLRNTLKPRATLPHLTSSRWIRTLEIVTSPERLENVPGRCSSERPITSAVVTSTLNRLASLTNDDYNYRKRRSPKRCQHRTPKSEEQIPSSRKPTGPSHSASISAPRVPTAPRRTSSGT